jgi:hypothetical protein
MVVSASRTMNMAGCACSGEAATAGVAAAIAAAKSKFTIHTLQRWKVLVDVQREAGDGRDLTLYGKAPAFHQLRASDPPARYLEMMVTD